MSNTTQKLTNRQREILAIIRSLTKRRRGIPPTIREIADVADVNIAAIQGHLVALKRKGQISHTPHIARGILVTGSKP
jgi:repressor LexA